ncbi:hypothetical protein [Actinomadura sp. WAC 06369]|uniref:hypothetical protein n=1 Tax=Actinomadura sp. WAC 06369 TaxID=2203193 RepID=UPI000F7745D0|nr:hypothetical protein [Actinomadura sp. WAC 06369]RSN66622.1 hypothetical protein DMH08_15675 [Actinomadura sp. WAC 06369]
MAYGVAPPEATGGAGTIFEYRVAAFAFSRLLRGAHVPVGIDLPVESVALQQRIAGSLLDDIVMRAGPPHQHTTIEFQVKKQLAVTGSSQALISLLGQAAETWSTREHALKTGRLLLGAAAAGPSDDLADLAELAARAHDHTSLVSFQSLLVEKATNQRLRTRHAHIVKAMSAATGITEPSELGQMTHQVLSRLHVWRVEPFEDGRDRLDGLDDLAELARHTGQSAAILLALLAELAEEVGPHGGDLDAHQVRARFQRKYGIALPERAGQSSPIEGGARFEGDVTFQGPVYLASNQVFNGMTINTHYPPASPRSNHDLP